MKNLHFKIILILSYFMFIIISSILNYSPGKMIADNFYSFALTMVQILPCAFILIGLFDTWVKKETVEKHLGDKSPFIGYLWAIILAGTTVGGLYVALPVAYSLYKKGARLSIIFTYTGAAGICRIPMTVFEASFLGIKFTIIRLLVSIPLVIISSILLEIILKNKGFKILVKK